VRAAAVVVHNLFRDAGITDLDASRVLGGHGRALLDVLGYANGTLTRATWEARQEELAKLFSTPP